MPPASARARPEPASKSNSVRFDRIDLVVALSLLVVVALRGAWEWRVVDRFLGDHGWYFRVAERVASGAMLYRDVGWDYGPLPVYVLARLFQISKTLVWTEVLDLILAGASVWAVYVIARRLTGRRIALWLTVWATFLGASEGLLTFHLEAYTSAVAWGATTSLLAVVVAGRWVAGRSVAALAAALVLAAAAILSKPEFGLAASSVVTCALLQRHPTRAFTITAIAVVVIVALGIGLGASPATLQAWWRGYSGYDLIAVGQVPLANVPRMFGALLAAALFALCLVSGVVRLGAVGIVAIFVVYRLSTGTSMSFLLDLASAVVSTLWVGAVPAVLWLAWKTRSAGAGRETWILAVYAVVVNLRMLLHGEFCVAAAGPVAALSFFAVQRGLFPRPSPGALLVLAVAVLLFPVREEIRSLRRAQRTVPVETSLGVARVHPQVAADILGMRAALADLPAGPLFVSGWGPCWYFVSGRRNPTRFDGLLDGIGVTGPELPELLDDLRSDPPAVVVTERDFVPSAGYSHETLWATIGRRFESSYTSPSRRWEVFVAVEGGGESRAP